MNKPQGRVFISSAVLLLNLLLAASAGAASSPVIAWGGYENGQTNVPPSLTNATAIAASWNFSLALQPDGTVQGWGNNNAGQTTPPADLTNATAIAAGYAHGLALTAQGRVVAWGDNSLGQTNVPPGLTNVVAIAAGWYHSLALRADGTVAGWYYNSYGQTNIPSGLTNVVAIAAGGNRCMALKANGSIVSWGAGPYWPTTNSGNFVAIAAGSYHSLALTADGRVLAYGDNSQGQTYVPAGLSHVVAIAAGTYHSLALRADGTVLGWGRNVYGEATPGPGLTNVVAIAAGNYHSVALVGNGPPFLTAPLIDRSVIWRRLAYFHAPATGLRPLAYQWQVNGTNLPGGTNAVLALTNVQEAGTYSVTVSNSEGSITSAPASLRVLPFEFLWQPSDRTAYDGQIASFTVGVDGPQPITYRWHFQGVPLADDSRVSGASAASMYIQNIQASDAGAYSVSISNAVGTAISRTAIMTVTNPPPSIFCEPQSQSRDAGSSASFYVCISSASTYSLSWYHNDTLLTNTSNNLVIDNLQLSDAGSYWCVVSNRGGVATSQAATLTVLVRPAVIPTSPVNQTVDAGGSVCLSAGVDGAPMPALQWYLNGQPIPGATDPTYCIVNASVADGGFYHLVASNVINTVVSDTASVTVLFRPPVISDGPYDQTVWVDRWVSFSCTVQGGPRPQLQWLFNEQPIRGANNPNLSFPVNSTNQSGGYSLVASNMYGMVTSVVAHLTVRVSPPYFYSEPVSRGVLEGEPVTFSAYASASGPVQCQWQFNGQIINGATQYNLTIQHTARSDAGDYRIIISNEGGSITSRVATLVISLPGPLDRWEWRQPLPQGNDLQCVAYGNGIWVTSGKEGARIRSTDGGVTWQTSSMARERTLALAYGNGVFAAAGFIAIDQGFGFIQTSTDGLHWTERLSLQPSEEIQDITYGNGRFVAVTSYGVTIVSTNGQDWEWAGTLGLSPVNLTFGNNTFVAVAPNSSATSTDGISWQMHPNVLNGSPSAVIFGNGMFVAITSYVDYSSHFYSATWVSPDGIYWVEAAQAQNQRWHGLAYGCDNFVFWTEPWSGGEYLQAISSNGVDWVFYQPGLSNLIMATAGTEQTLMAVGDKGIILTSSNAMDWVARSPGDSLNLRSVTYGNGLYVAVGNEGLLFTSSNGVNWVRRAPVTEYNLRSIAYGNGQFVAVGEIATNVAVIVRSSDGLEWTGSEATVYSGLYSVVFGKGLFVAVGYYGAILTSTDGYSWTYRNTGWTGRFNAVTFNGQDFAAVGTGGTIATSVDGLLWSWRTSSTSRFLQGVAYGNGRFVAAGQTGGLTVSTNALDWYGPTDTQYAFEAHDIEDVQFANGQFIAVGENGYIASSVDGLVWTRHHSHCQNTLRCSVYVKGHVTAVGNNATILRSDFFGPPALHVWRSATPDELTLAVDAEVGGTYRLQTSEDFIQWDDIFTFRNTQVRTMFLDSDLGFIRKQFYRVVTP